MKIDELPAKYLRVIRRDVVTGSERVLGTLVKRHDGWWFMSNVASHGNSRKAHQTWEAALPRWTGGINAVETVPK